MEYDNLKLICRQPTKSIWSAVVPEYGNVIIKKDEDREQLRAEYGMLSSLNGRGSCRVYFFDEAKGILIEEQIVPGTVLRKEASLEKRLEVLKDIYDTIHVPVTAGKSYLDWLTNIKNYCEQNQLEEYWQIKSKLAYDICKELFAKYKERLLLHGDLHHDNILQREDGSYAMIDPKGIVGPAILDLPRFILNELDTEYEVTPEEHIAEVIGSIGEKFDYPRMDIAKAFVMEAIMGNVWFIEDGLPINQKALDVAEYILKELE